MITTEDLLLELKARGIEVWTEGDELRLRAPREALSPERRRLLSERKDEIVQLLSLLSRQAGPRLRARRADCEALPLSFAQERLWFLEQLEGARALYNTCWALRVRGPLDAAVWRRSLDTILARHEALRSTFVVHDGQPEVRLLEPNAGVTLTVQDLSDVSDTVAQLAKIKAKEVASPFDLAQGPLIRGRLIRLAPREHVVLVTIHHIVFDGWSLGILARELSALYNAFISGHEDPLPPLEIQYPDYAVWQRQWLQGERLKAQADYWRRMLADAPVLLELPLEHARAPEQDFRGAALPLRLNAELTADLKRLARRCGGTLFTLLLSAWAVVFARLSGQNDLVIGTPSANRRQRQIEGVIGFFVNMLALRIDLKGEPCVAELLNRVRTVVVDAQDHQDLPFERVVEIVQPPRRLDRSPVFQVSFTWQNYRSGELDLPGLHAQPEPMMSTDVKYDLEFILAEHGDGITGRLGYATALFDAATIERYRGYFIAVLRAMIADDQQPVTTIDLLSPQERTQLLEEWNRTEAPYPGDCCVHELFEEQVARDPAATALFYQDRSLSYGELNARANRLARHLVQLGVRPDEHVALCVERSVEMVVGLLAVLKAGGAYVPLDPAYPPERLAFMLKDCAPRIVLTHAPSREALAAALAGLDEPPLILDLLADASLWSQQPDADLNSANTFGLASHHLAYVIYTSGSTGFPKGVMIEHRGVVRLVRNNGFLRIAADDVLLNSSSATFDATTFELWGALLNGARLVLYPHPHIDVAELERTINTHHITIAWLTARLFDSFVQIDPCCGSLRYLLVGGESVLASSVQKFYARHEPLQILNGYGPTENTTFSLIYPIPRDLDTAESLPIGRPIANSSAYVLDSRLRPVPLGAVGEIYVGGAGVARGYLNRPELTAERFLDNPFVPGDRLYRTGDLGRCRLDGNLLFLGRTDQQVKIRGFRIELGEIEARLTEHPDVREAVVLAREDQPGEKRLVAYLLYAPHNAAQHASAEHAAELRAHLAARLPEYMLPAAYVALEVLPLTPNGKLDRKALPAPDQSAYARRAYEAPRGEIEQTLATLWAELLGVDRVSRYDNFFELGGHSLLAIQLLERLRRLELNGGVRALFDAPVLADFAASLGARSAILVPPNALDLQSTELTPGMLPLIDLTQEDIERIIAETPGGLANIQDLYALSPLQEGILFHHLMATQGDPYLIATLLAFPERALLDRYLAAFQQVSDRHDILRTAFHWQGLSTPAQVVHRRVPMSLTELVLDPQEGPAEEQLRERFNPRHHRIALTEPPLLCFVIAFDPAQRRWLLLMLLHHLIGDHSTLEILQEEVRAFLEGRGEGLPAPQPFRNLIAQVRLGVSVAEHERFFRTQLADIQEPTAPFGLLDVHRDGSAVTEARQMLPQELNERLRAQARRLGVSLASLCHLAWAQVLARATGRQAVVFGTVLFGRLHAAAGAEAGMGLFINTLPLRLDIDISAVEEAVRRTHARLAELLQHEHASLVIAQRCSGVDPQTPLFSALLNYRHNRLRPTSTPDPEVAGPIVWLGGEERTNYPLVLSVEDLGEALGLTAQVLDPVSPERICRYMQQALDSLAETLERSPASPVRDLEVLPAEERTRLLEEWNRTEAPYPGDCCVHELFEEQVARDPAATALFYQDRSLSYGELNARANRLARHLVQLGVRPDEHVALCVERSVEMVVGLLAVLKAGGAYVPLDPAYPPERLAFMLKDCAPRIVLTHAPSREALAAALAGLDEPPLILDLLADASLWSQQPDADLNSANTFGLASHHLAYVIYTSGSTGFPKGVMIEHRGVVRLVRNNGFLRIAADDVLLNSSSATFDATTFELWGALLNGARLVLYPHPHIDVAELERTINTHHITIAWLTARLFDSFVQIDPCCGSLRYLLVGGESVLASSVQKFYARHEPLQILNGYGPTENTTFSLIYPIPRDLDTAESLPIGRPIANSSAYVLDSRLRPVPLGAVGEIYVGGAGVARGYLNRPELTAERFLDNPFVPGDRLYRTGDLGRCRLDGNLLFLGRTDQQVKIRGFRIELGEIEARLTEHPDVREAVVLAREDQPGEKRLVAYLLYAPHNAAQHASAEHAAELRAHLAARLPEYMLPAAYVALEVLPLTPNGKLDRKALPAPDQSAYARRAYEAPRGEIEQTLATLWAELLGVDRVSRYDNFFELGGHSLLAVRMISQLSKRWLDPGIEDLLGAPVLHALAQRLENTDPSQVGTAAIPVRKSGSRSPVFFLPPGTGFCSYVPDIAKSIDAEWPIYALPWQSKHVTPLPTAEAMACRMAGLIQAVQPKGPYHVVGPCSGGLLAYAIAQHFLNRGEPVAFLGLIDTPLDGADGARRKRLAQQLRQTIQTAEQNLLQSETDLIGTMPRAEDQESLTLESQKLRALPTWVSEQIVHFSEVLSNYNLPSLPVVMHQFNAMETVSEEDAAIRTNGTLGWDRLLPRTAIYPVMAPGNHFTMLMDAAHVAQLGLLISAALHEVSASAPKLS